VFAILGEASASSPSNYMLNENFKASKTLKYIGLTVAQNCSKNSLIA